MKAMGDQIPSDDDTKGVVQRIDGLLGELDRLRQNIAAASEQERRSRSDRRCHRDRRSGEERREEKDLQERIRSVTDASIR
jgi:hypothetical protein